MMMMWECGSVGEEEFGACFFTTPEQLLIDTKTQAKQSHRYSHRPPPPLLKHEELPSGAGLLVRNVLHSSPKLVKRREAQTLLNRLCIEK